MPRKRFVNKQQDPNKLIVTKKRAQYLAELAKVDQKEIAGKKIGEVNELLKWRIDPELLLFRRICGRVVKQDANGDYCPVPGATVHVEDTDCSFLGFFPNKPPFFWLYPLKCKREKIATVTTDACGYFCVNLPYWDIDRLLKLRRIRLCLIDLYRPRLKDIIELLPEPPVIKKPRPEPDPFPLKRCCVETVEKVRLNFGEDIAERLSVLTEMPELGANTNDLTKLFDTSLPSSPPPMHSLMQQHDQSDFSAVAEMTGIEEKLVSKIDFSRVKGPFIRCRDVWVAEWTPILDVPDITFRVTQDVDGDGKEETIYSEGFFDVRWDAPAPLEVTLVANANALCVPICEPIPDIPCTNIPVINTAGYMPLLNSHHNDTTGYGKRVNRPVTAPGDYPPPPSIGAGANNSVAPYAYSLNLHGCHRIKKASHYRLTYILNGVGSPVPFTGLTWWTPKSAIAPGPPIHVVPDPDGWYPILAAELVEHPSWLLHWNTRSFPNGTFEVRLETGRMDAGGISEITTSAPRMFTVDNSKPEPGFIEIRWRYEDVIGPWTDANSTVLPAVCPVIERDLSRGTVRVRISWRATATHLRDAHITFTGCGAGNPLLVQPTPAAPDIEEYRHWHVNQFDNTVLQVNEYQVPPTLAPGCYGLWVFAASRAFNPSGFDHGPSANWFINQTLLWRRSHRAISVVNL